MGDVFIKEGKLILKTNSIKRAEKGKKLLVKLLGNNIEFEKMLIESAKQKMKSLPKEREEQNDGLNLMDIPEVQEQMKAMAKAHWESWFDEPISALDNKSPRKAARTKQGREQLVALLFQYESMDRNKDKNDPFIADIDFIKKILKLTT